MNQSATGPVTEQGKFESSKNAFTHGLTAANIDRFPAEVREAFAAFLSAQYAEWRPVTLNERIYLERYAFLQFQLLRSESLVSAALDSLLADPLSEAAQKRHLILARHFRSLERSTKESLAELRRMIADRLVEASLAEQDGLQPMSPLTPHHLLAKAMPAPAPDPVRFAPEISCATTPFSERLSRRPSPDRAQTSHPSDPRSPRS